MKQKFLALAIGFTAIGCARYGQEGEKEKSCGCQSPIIKSDLNGRGFNGSLYYDSYEKKYMIYTYNGGNPLAYQNAICNDNLLPKELKNIEVGKRLEVVYKANFKDDCRTIQHAIDWKYYNIELIEIKLKN